VVTTLTPGTIAGGATVIGFNGTAGQVVTVIDAVNGEVLGSVTVPATGPSAVTLGTPANSGDTLRFVVNGMAGPTVTVGAAGLPPIVTQGAVLVEGSTLTGTGLVGATIQVVDSLGHLLGSTTVAADSTWVVLTSGATAGTTVKVVQNGVAVTLAATAQRLGAETAFTGANLFKPGQGGSLDIGFKALQDGRLSVRIFNVAGETVRNLAFIDVQAGVLYALKWNGRNDDGQTVAAGIYVISVQGGGVSRLRKVVVLK
jgi:hypothetical protein